MKHSSTSRRPSVETLQRELKPVVTEKKRVWWWRRSNLTRTISKIRTTKIPMQGMKCSTLKSKGLPEVESLELTPRWKSTMLALFGKFGLSELWCKDQTNDFSIDSSNTCVKRSDWVLHGRNQTSSLEVWNWISSDQNHYQITEFSDSQDSDANWCQDRNNAFQKEYRPTSVTFPIEILMEGNKPGLRRKMSLNSEEEQSLRHFFGKFRLSGLREGRERNQWTFAGKIPLQLKNSWLRPLSEYSSSAVTEKKVFEDGKIIERIIWKCWTNTRR